VPAFSTSVFGSVLEASVSGELKKIEDIPTRKQSLAVFPRKSLRVNFLSKKSFILFTFSQLLIGIVGSFSETKDQATLIGAFLDIVKRRRDVVLILVGDGPLLDYYRKMIDSKFVDRIYFAGNQNDVESFVNIFDIGVLSTFTEGISNAIMEYMALGKPVIASKGGGTEELVLHNKSGILYDPGEKNQLIEAIELLINDLNKAKTMGEIGRKRIEQVFNISNMAYQTIDLYKELLEN